MRPIDLLGFGPKYEVSTAGDGYLVKVTPPAFMGGKTVEVPLTAQQYLGYIAWKDKGQLIQDALPDLSPSQREMLLTGLDDEAFKAACGSDEDDEDEFYEPEDQDQGDVLGLHDERDEP